MSHRRYQLRELLKLVQHIPGDTAECGVFKGCGSRIILDNTQAYREHHAFDSFQGLSDPGSQDGKYWKPGDMTVKQEEFLQRFDVAHRTRLRVYPGWIPDRFN